MKITVDRFHSDDDATLSRILLDGKFFCFGLEDEYREEKVPGETRIPPGEYKMGLRKTGGMHGRYGAKFDFHKGMLHVLDVPEFEWIYIHVGNTDAHTAGCLLVGTGATTDGELRVTGSVNAYRALYGKVFDQAGWDDLEIEFLDNDQPCHTNNEGFSDAD